LSFALELPSPDPVPEAIGAFYGRPSRLYELRRIGETALQLENVDAWNETPSSLLATFVAALPYSRFIPVKPLLARNSPRLPRNPS